MVNVKSKTCIEPNCRKQPSFNTADETTALYCASHKKENMVNVKHKTCIEPNCRKIPAFGFKNDKKPTLCINHKKKK